MTANNALKARVDRLNAALLSHPYVRLYSNTDDYSSATLLVLHDPAGEEVAVERITAFVDTYPDECSALEKGNRAHIVTFSPKEES